MPAVNSALSSGNVLYKKIAVVCLTSDRVTSI